MRRKDRPAKPEPLASGTAKRLEAIVEAAEQAAVGVIDDAEKQARERLEQAEAEAERRVSERLAELSDLTDSLIAQAEEVRAQSERLVAVLDEAKRRLAGGDASEAVPSAAARPARASHLTAVAPLDEEEPSSGDGRGTPAGARLLATQMAVSGSSRAEIEARLRDGFGLEETDSILDAILGPEE